MNEFTRWQRIEHTFHAVADDAPGPARDARVLDLCGQDAGMAAEIGTLLDADATAPASEGPVAPHVGLRLGSYEITGLIARGGMAAVYDARRADDQFEQRVAIKIMDLRLSDPALVAQFRAERQILAGLEHPALTRLLDGGVTPTGEPYLVMEYVDGQPLDRHCDARHLDVPARLRLFTAVCEGVAFAHRNLVLHRDLKPSNILVTSDGHAKVVDFGTATLLQPDRLSTLSKAPLTPAYASPEQLTGQAVGTASDQYSLGLVLYELLSGAMPFADSTSLIAAMERALTRTTTTAPHTAVTAAAAAARRTTLAKLRRTLAGDLGIIVGKTLAHEPAARYASVQHVIDDLARWTSGEAIEGRAPSLAYRTSRFVRRHWIAVAVAASLLVALLGATAVSVQQARVARAESGKARQLNRFLTQMLSSANPSWYNANAGQAGSITVRQVLDGAGALIATELADAPEVEAEMRRTLGRTYIGLGAFDQAAPHLRRAFELHATANDTYGVAFTTHLLSEVHQFKGEFDEAEPLARTALAYFRTNGGDDGPELHMITASDLATVIAGQRPLDPEIVALYRESIAVADEHHLNPAGTGVVVNNLGSTLINVGRLDEAEPTLRDALRRMDALPAPPPEKSYVLANLSRVLRLRGNFPEAVRLGEASTDLATRSYPPDHPFLGAPTAIFGRALVANGELERGRQVLTDALRRFRQARPKQHPDLTRALIGLGIVHRLEGHLADSERALIEARDILASHPDIKEPRAETAGELGMTLRALGRAGEADALLKESYDAYRVAFGDTHPGTVQAKARLSEGP